MTIWFYTACWRLPHCLTYRFGAGCGDDSLHFGSERRGGVPRQHHAGRRRLQLQVRLVLLHGRCGLPDLRDGCRGGHHALPATSREAGGDDPDHSRTGGEDGPGNVILRSMWGAESYCLLVRLDCRTWLVSVKSSFVGVFKNDLWIPLGRVRSPYWLPQKRRFPGSVSVCEASALN